MALLSEKDRDILKGKFEAELKGDVEITLFTQGESGLMVPGQECPACKDTRQLLEEVTALSDKLRLKVLDFVADADKAKEHGVDKIPATLLRAEDGAGIRFFGLPSGYEFAVLVEDLLGLSKGSSGLADSTREQLKAIARPTHIQVFVTPTCPYCSRMARLAHQLAQENAHITADVVEVTEFPHLAQRYDIMSVPKVVINDNVEFTGVVPEARFAEETLRASKG